MKVEQRKWENEKGWEVFSEKELSQSAQLVIAFGDRNVLENKKRFEELRGFYPLARILMASTSGDILDTTISDETIVATGICFEKTPIEVAQINIEEVENSFEAGEKLARALLKGELVHLFVISDGQLVNGSELVKGLSSQLSRNVVITGGLAGDGTRFEKTLVGLDAPPSCGRIGAIGFYGKQIKIGFGSMGGWDPFGPERKVTKSKGNVLYELDGQSALELYKKYLGDQAKDLPSSGLLFPLAIRLGKTASPLVRTILNVDEREQSLIFAGNVPEGAYAQLMKANFDRLINGAALAANASHEMLGDECPDLAILISCVGRRLVLDQRSEEELERVKDILGTHVTMAGFYSFGEIAPTAPKASCELHNQTMTITTLSERN